MDSTDVRNYIERVWNESVLAELIDYVRIPNKSPAFDRDWQANGHMEQAITRFARWAHTQALSGATVEIQRIDQRTPLLLTEVPATDRRERARHRENDCILLYGHLDKQPEMTGWRDGFSAWQPVIEGDRLYGRGAADDGYALFACLTAIAAL